MVFIRKQLHEKQQGRIHGQKVVACGCAGAVLRVDRGSMRLGRAQKLLLQSISRQPKFRATDLSLYLRFPASYTYNVAYRVK